MKKTIILFSILLLPVVVFSQVTSPGSDIIGKWNITFTIEGEELENLGLFRHGLYADEGFPAWLEVKRSGFSVLVGYYVGYEGSARPISEVKYDQDRNVYHFAIPPQWMNIEDDIYFEFSLDDNKLAGYKILDGNTLQFSGNRQPTLKRDKPPVWGSPKNLLDDNMSSWIIPENNKFKMIDGVLTNEAVGGNLVTKERYNDFKLSAEFRYPDGSNSGIYLRGRYEVQIEDNYEIEQPGDIHMGGIYGFIAPSVNASKPGGEWQTYEITLVGRHVTIVLNGVEVVSNRPIPGITGGSLNSREGEPGPIMIQGDHGPIEFSKLVITPAINP